MCQLLSTPDYNIIFKTLQENYMNDDIDDYYECIWDLALLESLISKRQTRKKNKVDMFDHLDNLNQRGYDDKKRLAVSHEIIFKIRQKQTTLFSQLDSYM